MSNQSFHQQKTNCCSVFFQTLDLETSTMPVSLCPRGVEALHMLPQRSLRGRSMRGHS